MPYGFAAATKIHRHVDESIRVAPPFTESETHSTRFTPGAYVAGSMMKCFVWFALTLLAFTGCGDKREEAPTTGSYGPPSGKVSAQIERVRPDRSAETPWTNGALSVVQTELSPATLWHSTSRTLSFFANMPQTGLGGPSYVCMSTELGPKIFQPGANIDPQKMRESWFVVWWAGAKGWTNWDSPWFLTLQHRPEKISFDTNGLRFTFRGEAGYAALMPMYGYFKPLPTGSENSPFARLKEKKKRILTWEWSKALPADPLARARYWASALREFPIYCEDSFSVDRAHDRVVLRQKFRFISWDDDWKTKHLKLAPVSPVLALAYLDGFPAEFTKKPDDMQIFTPYGPYFGVEGVDQYDVTLPVLRYLNETEVVDGNVTNTPPIVQSALKKLRDTARAKFSSPDKYNYDHGGLNNFCWAIQGDEWYAKALPYMDDATRSIAIASLKKYFREDVLVTNRFKLREFPKGSGHSYYILEGPGIGSWGVLGDAGKFSANMLQTIWAYAHFTGDWDLIRERWPLIKMLFTTPAETRWVGFGRDAIAELGDEAAPCLAFARLAYKIGDMESYNYACQMFARELAHLWAKQRGAKYFRENQPWHSMEAMDDEVYLTNLWGDLAGWQIDGPKYPAKVGERQFNNRWVRFKNEDVARFYRDYLFADVKREFDLLQTRWPAERKWKNDSHIMPSLVQLRSLFLNESPFELASNAPPEKYSGPASGVIASCVSVLRTSHPTRYERLIPGGEASPFVAGIEREIAGPNVILSQNVVSKTNSPPRITWWGWKTPAGAIWNFGEVITATNARSRAETISLNWNTRVTMYHE